MQNATQIFHIDQRKPSDLEPAYINTAVQDLISRLVVIRGRDKLSVEAQNNAVRCFAMDLRATFAACQVLECHHLNQEAFEWVLGKFISFTSLDRLSSYVQEK